MGGAQLEQVSEFKYLGYVLDESGARKVAGAIRPQVSARGLQLECTSVLHEALLLPVLLYTSETMMWREKNRIWDGQPQRYVGYEGNGKISKCTYYRVCGVTKGVDESALQGFGHTE